MAGIEVELAVKGGQVMAGTVRGCEGSGYTDLALKFAHWPFTYTNGESRLQSSRLREQAAWLKRDPEMVHASERAVSFVIVKLTAHVSAW